MDKARARQITAERLAKWAEKLALNTATPVMLLGIGHGSDLGKLAFCVTEDITSEVLEAFLLGCVDELRNARKRRRR